jgi:hypothetical protein
MSFLEIRRHVNVTKARNQGEDHDPDFNLILIFKITVEVLKVKGCTRLAAASDKVYQLLAHGRSYTVSLRVLRLLPPLKLVALI